MAGCFFAAAALVALIAFLTQHCRRQVCGSATSRRDRHYARVVLAQLFALAHGRRPAHGHDRCSCMRRR